MWFNRWLRRLRSGSSDGRPVAAASRGRGRNVAHGRLLVRALEDRTLLNGHTLAAATPVSLLDVGNGRRVAAAAGFLQHGAPVDLFAVNGLKAGDRVTAAVQAQAIGSGLDAALRVFDAGGTPVAFNNDYHGRDPQLTFQASHDGTYYIGVSGFGQTYDPINPVADVAGESTGVYRLQVALTHAAPQPDLQGASFQLDRTTAVWGDKLAVRFTVENRGGADMTGPFSVQFVLSTNNRFDGSSPEVVLGSFDVDHLKAGAAFTSDPVPLTLPGSAFAAGTQFYLGMKVGTGYANSPEHGNDWEALTVLTPQMVVGTHDSTDTATGIAFDPGTSSVGEAGTIPATGHADYFTFTLTQPGRLTAEVFANGLPVRLSLSDSGDRPLVQSDGGAPGDARIVQYLNVTGGTTFFLKVEGLDGATGSYVLATTFTAGASAPFQPIGVGKLPEAVVTGDFNGDGNTDLAVANGNDGTVNVFLGQGDGTFGPAATLKVGAGASALVAGDFNGDGRTDLAVAAGNGVTLLLGQGDGTFAQSSIHLAGPANGLVTGDFNDDGRTDLAVGYADGRVVVLLGDGDGKFQSPLLVGTVAGPAVPTVGEFTGGGHTDLAVADQDHNTVTVFLGNGDGSFRTFAGNTFSVGKDPIALAAGDFNGDGHTDLAVANYRGDTVSILLGQGDGTFVQSGQPVPVGSRPFDLTAGDFNGDGHTDLATVNTGANTVSVLLGQGDGTFQAQAPVRVSAGPSALAAADFNDDGRTDLVTVNFDDNSVDVLLGKGDGTFQTAAASPVGSKPIAVISTVGDAMGRQIALDFNGDGRTDLAIANFAAGTVSILLGNGDGTFHYAPPVPAGAGPFGLAAGHFTGDGHIDLAVVNYQDDTVSILLGCGDGTFKAGPRISVGHEPAAVVAGHFDSHDLTDDLAVANLADGTVSVLLGNGDGTFRAGPVIGVGSSPRALVTGDFDGIGGAPEDIAVANSGDNSVTILLGKGDGTFSTAPLIHLGKGKHPASLAAGDFEGNGRTDLAVANYKDGTVSILLGDGHGGFSVSGSISVAPHLRGIVAGQFDGHTDLAVANYDNNTVSLLLGNGDGTFNLSADAPAGSGPFALAAGDFNGDNQTDLAAVNYYSGTVTVLLGDGKGAFNLSADAPVGSGPAALVTGDFNGDGRTDVAIANYLQGTVDVLLGNGDGTFQPAAPVPAGPGPLALVAGDFNGDGATDLAVANYADPADPLSKYRTGLVTILLGNGDGTFQVAARIPVQHPTAIAAGAFTGDGHIDLAVASAGDGLVTVLLGQGDGSFRTGQTIAVGSRATALVAGNFIGDGHTDLAVANSGDNTVSVLAGNGDGTFRAGPTIAVGSDPIALGKGKFNKTGPTDDLAVANYLDNSVTVLLSNGDGTFQTLPAIPVGTLPGSLAAGDFNSDGKTDLAVGSLFDGKVTVLLGNGDGTFGSGTTATAPAVASPAALVTGSLNGANGTDLAVANLANSTVNVLLADGLGDLPQGGQISNPPRSAPLVGDFNGDGTPDVATLAANGKILVRLGRPGEPGSFGAPIIVNPQDGFEAHDVTVLHAGGKTLLAAIDGQGTDVSFYLFQDGSFSHVAQLAVPGGAPAVRIAARDLRPPGTPGNPLDDLIVATSGQDTTASQGPMVYAFVQDPAGSLTSSSHFVFQGPAASSTPIGVDPSSIFVRDVTGDGLPDVLVTDPFSGTVAVLANTGNPMNPFAAATVYRAGTGAYTTTTVGNLFLQSAEATSGVTAGVFDEATHRLDLVVANPGSAHVSLLEGTGAGGFANPVDLADLPGLHAPAAVVTGDFNGDHHLDLAVLDAADDTVLVFTGDGQGHFRLVNRVAAGNDPTGLRAFDLAGDGKLDLLVSNAEGGVVVLIGNGDGTFQPQRAERTISVTSAEVNGQGVLIFADEGRDRVTIQYPSGPPTVLGSDQGISGPSAVAVADLNRDGRPDLVVANSASNEILVFLGTDLGTFALTPVRNKVGNTPAGLTVADVNGDGTPDLVVADQGSDDVKVLLGQGSGAGWTLVNGPRLAAGFGPVATVVADVTGNGIPDILVSNGQSNDVRVLSGIGKGFFDARHPAAFPVGQDPGPIFLAHFGPGPGPQLITVNSRSNDLTYFAGVGGPFGELPSGGTRPVAALAVDLNGDGFTDLVVLNQGAGPAAPPNVAIFFGSSVGLRLAEIAAVPDLSDPTGLAVVSRGGALQVEVAGAGVNVALSLNTVSLVPTTVQATVVAGPAASSSAAGGQVTGITIIIVAPSVQTSVTPTGINVAAATTTGEGAAVVGAEAGQALEGFTDAGSSALAERGVNDVLPGTDAAAGLLTGTKASVRLRAARGGTPGAVPVYSTTSGEDAAVQTGDADTDRPGLPGTMTGLRYRYRPRQPAPARPKQPAVPLSGLTDQARHEGVLAAAGVGDYQRWLNDVSLALARGTAPTSPAGRRAEGQPHAPATPGVPPPARPGSRPHRAAWLAGYVVLTVSAWGLSAVRPRSRNQPSQANPLGTPPIWHA